MTRLRFQMPSPKDGFSTLNQLSFLQNPHFVAAKKRAIEFGGFDYQIDLRLHQAIWAAQTALRNPKRGIFVELGTGKGYVMSAVLEYLALSKLSIGSVFLIDTFLPYKPNSKGDQLQENETHFAYATDFARVQENFRRFPFVTIIRGRLPEALDKLEDAPIVFLHIDLNHVGAELECIEKLWHRIVPGGIVLLDDYANAGQDATNFAWNEWTAANKVQILTTASGQGIFIKF